MAKPNFPVRQPKYEDRRYLKGPPQVTHGLAVEAWAVKRLHAAPIDTAYFDASAAQGAAATADEITGEGHYLRIMVMRCTDGKWRRLTQVPISMKDKEPDLDHVNAYKRAWELWEGNFGTLETGVPTPPTEVLNLVQYLVNTNLKVEILAASQILQIYADRYRTFMSTPIAGHNPIPDDDPIKRSP